MNVPMLPIEIIGLKSDLLKALSVLRKLGCVHIDELSEIQQVAARPLILDQAALRLQEEQNILLAKLEGLCATLGIHDTEEIPPAPEGYLEQARAGVETLMPKVQALTSRRDRLLAEQVSLPRYEMTLRKLMPLIPPSANEPGHQSVGVLVNRSHVAILDSVGRQAVELTKGAAEVVASDVDLSTRAMWIVFPREYNDQIEALLGREDVTRLRLPAEFSEGSPATILASIVQRIALIPQELKTVEQELAGLAEQWRDRLCLWRAALRDDLSKNSVLSYFGETDMTFVMVGWVPANEFERVQRTLNQEIGQTIFLQRLPMTPEMRRRAPILLQNPPPARPFESLVKLFSLPAYGHIDPTRLMSFFMPLFFGMILGDVGYGILLLLICLGLLRKFHRGTTRDILLVLAMGSVWAIFFGFLFGEAFGTLGEHLGLHPLWFERTSAEYVGSLLVFTLGVGAVHITLGLILGIWEALRSQSRSHLLERGGMLIGLISLFFLTAVLTDVLPKDFMTPAVAGLMIGIALLGSSLGWLGILMGPIEFIGLIGNILSYLRIAAIGLASVYLAKVANDVAGTGGSLLVGVIVAVLIHALNLVLGAFSPTIHSLRLHYVEFFRKFYESGGKPYQPFKSRL